MLVFLKFFAYALNGWPFIKRTLEMHSNDNENESQQKMLILIQSKNLAISKKLWKSCADWTSFEKIDFDCVIYLWGKQFFLCKRNMEIAT